VEVKSCVRKSLGAAKPCRKSGRRRSKTRRLMSPRRMIGGRNLAMERVTSSYIVAWTEVETEVLRKISWFFPRKSRFFTRSSYAKWRLGRKSSAGA